MLRDGVQTVVQRSVSVDRLTHALAIAIGKDGYVLHHQHMHSQQICLC